MYRSLQKNYTAMRLAALITIILQLFTRVSFLQRIYSYFISLNKCKKYLSSGNNKNASKIPLVIKLLILKMLSYFCSKFRGKIEINNLFCHLILFPFKSPTVEIPKFISKLLQATWKCILDQKTCFFMLHWLMLIKNIILSDKGIT